MGCIHPGQIAVIHEAFAPSPNEIEKALKIVTAFEEAKSKGQGVVIAGIEDDRCAGCKPGVKAGGTGAKRWD